MFLESHSLSKFFMYTVLYLTLCFLIFCTDDSTGNISCPSLGNTPTASHITLSAERKLSDFHFHNLGQKITPSLSLLYSEGTQTTNTVCITSHFSSRGVIKYSSAGFNANTIIYFAQCEWRVLHDYSVRGNIARTEKCMWHKSGCLTEKNDFFPSELKGYLL